MLVLTLKEGEKLYIGDNVEVQIIRMNGRQARVGITAPKSVSVDREKIRQRKLDSGFVVGEVTGNE